MSKLFLDKTTLGSPFRVGYGSLIAVGHPKLDGHHRDLLSLLLHLMESLKMEKWDTKGNEVKKHIFDLFLKIREMALLHCEAEEVLLESWGFPDVEEHKEEHDLFLVRLDGFIHHCRFSGHPSPKQVKDFIRRWFLAHVNENDVKYRSYVPTVATTQAV